MIIEYMEYAMKRLPIFLFEHKHVSEKKYGFSAGES
jgi:hypothetical protein